MTKKPPRKIPRGAQMLRLLPTEHAAYKAAAVAEQRHGWSDWARCTLNRAIDRLRQDGLVPRQIKD